MSQTLHNTCTIRLIPITNYFTTLSDIVAHESVIYGSFARDVIIIFLKSTTKEPPKIYPIQAKEGANFIPVYNFTAQLSALIGKQRILKFRVMAVRDTAKLRSHLSKNIYLSHNF